MTCPRCQGFVLQEYGETRCLNCAWYENIPVCSPLVTNEAYRWESTRCLCGKPAIKMREQCMSCAGKRKEHAAAIKQGMKECKASHVEEP